MKQHRKFVALALVVFLVFLALGKYSQSTALASADVLYTTEVKDKKTGETVKFEIQRTKKDHYRVKNTKTGQVYETKAKHTKGNYVNIALPHNEGDIVIRKGLNPVSQPTVEVVNSQKYVQLDHSSTVTSTEPADDVTTQSSSSSSSTTSSQSTSSSSTDSSSKQASNSSEASTSSSTSSSSSSKAPEKLSLTTEQETDIMSSFGDWLYDSDYGKNAVLVQGKAYDNLGISASSAVFWSLKTSDDLPILARLIGYPKGNLADVTNAYANGKNATADELIAYKNSFEVTLLGNDLSSNRAEDFQSTAAFRLYTLKDPQHKHFTQTSDEEDFLETFDIPDSQKTSAKNMGYDYYYENDVNHDKDSYQIVLATDGKVYYTKDYWYDTNKSIEDYVYEEAPDDMQKAYTDLLEQYASTASSDDKSKTSSSSTTSESEKSSTKEEASSDEDSVFPKELLGTWTGTDTADQAVTITYNSDGSVQKEVKGTTDTTSTAKISKVEKVSDGLYRFAQGTDIQNALSIEGIGGVGVRYEYGYRVTDDHHITYVYWQGEANTDFDASTYQLLETENHPFTKQD